MKSNPTIIHWIYEANFIFLFSFPRAIWPGPPHYQGFTITLRHATLCRTSLDEWLVPRRDLYITTRNTHKGKTSMLPTGFESTVPASERRQTHSLDRAATTTGKLLQHLISSKRVIQALLQTRVKPTFSALVLGTDFCSSHAAVLVTPCDDECL
jgi:hypothetical protein